MNAAQAIPEGHADTNQIRVATRLDAAGQVLVEIADSGCGMSAELSARLFTPFVTTKPAGVGTGLGLAICQRIISAMGGEISFESQVNQGTVFRVVLPADDAPMTPRKIPPSVRPAVRRGTVLMIDDEPSLCTLVKKALGPEHDVVCTSSACDALAMLTRGAEFDVILCDIMMPVMTGAEFHGELVRSFPALVDRLVFLTGGAFTPSAREFIDGLTNPYLEKPFDLSAMRRLVNERVR